MCDVAGWIIDAVAACGTVAAVVVALWQVRLEKRARANAEKRRQVEKVSSWFGGPSSEPAPEDGRYAWQYVYLRNESESPVYDVIVTCVGLQGAGPARFGENNGEDYELRRYVGILPPGPWGIWLPTYGLGMHVVLGLEIAFRDSRGISWVRRGNGLLEGIPDDPAHFYRTPLPISWTACTRVEGK